MTLKVMLRIRLSTIQTVSGVVTGHPIADASFAAADANVEPARTGRMNHLGARARMKELARECMRDVRVLDTTHRAAFAHDADQLAAWLSASNLAAPHQRPIAPPVNPEPPAAIDAARQNEGG